MSGDNKNCKVVWVVYDMASKGPPTVAVFSSEQAAKDYARLVPDYLWEAFLLDAELAQ